MAAKRPVVTIFNADTGAKAGDAALPDVFTTPIRADIVHTVHKNMSKNKRQPYAVSAKAGHQHSAESWGTGRAVSRIPRVSGGGTHRAGQAAFGNMCRSGRMFNPTKVWRKWHSESNLNERRIAVCSALAASAVPALVMARGHRIENIAELPLVVSNSIETIEKTRDALALLKRVGALDDVERAKESKKVRTGKGKMRNRRYTMRKGPLLVHHGSVNVERSFRNIPGLDLAHVDRLNLLQLAPGGHLGRFVIFTQSAFEKLDTIFGTYAQKSAVKTHFNLPRSCMTNADVARLINSDEVQSRLNAAKSGTKRAVRKVNPLRNTGAMLRLNPYAKVTKREGLKNTVLKRKANVSSSSRAAKRSFLKGLQSMEAGTDEQPGADFLASFNRVLASRQ